MMGKAYVSNLAPFMEAFVAFKHSLGWKYETSEFYLRDFDRYFAEYDSEVASLKDVMRSWLILRDTECPNTQRVRVAPIREFGKYLQLSGYADSYVIPKRVCQKQIRIMPHFLTDDEIVKFFNVCDKLSPRKEKHRPPSCPPHVLQIAVLLWSENM